MLVAMNQDGTTPPDSAKDFQSDQDSASPAASGSSDQHDGQSSTDTTPPPQTEARISESYRESSRSGITKRYSNAGSSYSRSYQSVPMNNRFYAGSAPNNASFAGFRQPSYERRPPSSGITRGGDEDEAGLAAAVELLSCSFGTPRTGSVALSADIPPVPPLPAQYQSYSSFSTSHMPSSHQTQSFAARHNSQSLHDGEDVNMDESAESAMDDDEYDMRSRDRSDEDDDGVFGHMEE